MDTDELSVLVANNRVLGLRASSTMAYVFRQLHNDGYIKLRDDTRKSLKELEDLCDKELAMAEEVMEEGESDGGE